MVLDRRRKRPTDGGMLKGHSPMADDLEALLLEKIEAVLVKHNIKPSAFGRAAIGDQNLVSELREGKRNLTTKTIRKINDYITGLEKPLGTKRAKRKVA